MTVGLALQCGGVSGRGKQRRVNWRKNGRTRTKTNVATYCGHRHTVKRCLQLRRQNKAFQILRLQSFPDCKPEFQDCAGLLHITTRPKCQKGTNWWWAIVKSLCPRCRKYRGLVVVSPTIGDFSQRSQIANAENAQSADLPSTYTS